LWSTVPGADAEEEEDKAPEEEDDRANQYPGQRSYNPHNLPREYLKVQHMLYHADNYRPAADKES
jgi:hypothetical protein